MKTVNAILGLMVLGGIRVFGVTSNFDVALAVVTETRADGVVTALEDGGVRLEAGTGLELRQVGISGTWTVFGPVGPGVLAGGGYVATLGRGVVELSLPGDLLMAGVSFFYGNGISDLMFANGLADAFINWSAEKEGVVVSSGRTQRNATAGAFVFNGPSGGFDLIDVWTSWDQYGAGPNGFGRGSLLQHWEPWNIGIDLVNVSLLPPPVVVAPFAFGVREGGWTVLFLALSCGIIFTVSLRAKPGAVPALGRS